MTSRASRVQSAAARAQTAPRPRARRGCVPRPVGRQQAERRAIAARTSSARATQPGRGAGRAMQATAGSTTPGRPRRSARRRGICRRKSPASRRSVVGTACWPCVRPAITRSMCASACRARASPSSSLERHQAVDGSVQLQSETGVHDVLRGGTVVQRTALRLGQSQGDLAHQREDRIAHVGWCSFQSAGRSTFASVQAAAIASARSGSSSPTSAWPRASAASVRSQASTVAVSAKTASMAASPKARCSIEKMLPAVAVEPLMARCR